MSDLTGNEEQFLDALFRAIAEQHGCKMKDDVTIQEMFDEGCSALNEIDMDDWRRVARKMSPLLGTTIEECPV